MKNFPLEVNSRFRVGLLTLYKLRNRKGKTSEENRTESDLWDKNQAYQHTHNGSHGREKAEIFEETVAGILQI